MRVSLILGECREEIYKQKKEVPKAHRDIFVEIMEVRVISEKAERTGSLYTMVEMAETMILFAI